MKKVKLIRITTVPMSLKILLSGQMKFMKEKGFVVIMISSDGNLREELIKVENCKHLIIPLTRKITPLQDIYCLIKLISLFRKLNPDIVHSHTPKAGFIGMTAAYLCRIPVRMHTIAGFPLIVHHGIKKWILIQIEKITYKFATNVYPNSLSNFNYFKQNILQKPKKLKLIGRGSSNGIDLERFSTKNLVPPIIQEIKEKLNYSDKNRYFITIGRMVKDKGIEELVRVFKKLSQSVPNIKLILLGPFEKSTNNVSSIIYKEILKNNEIIHIPWSNKVEYFLAISDFLVHPSHREGFPNVLLQAGAMSCPVICSDINGNIDLIENEKTGLLFRKKDEDDLYNKMVFALNSPELINSYSNNLLATIKKYFDQKAIHQLIFDEYKNLLATIN